jgi:hypothetical protein
MRALAFSLLCLVSTASHAQQKGGKLDRLKTMDANKDGKVAKEELGEKFWSRAAGFDAGNGSSPGQRPAGQARAGAARRRELGL